MNRTTPVFIGLLTWMVAGCGSADGRIKSYEGFDYEDRVGLLGAGGGTGWGGAWRERWFVTQDGSSLNYPAGSDLTGVGGRLHVVVEAAQDIFRPLPFVIQDDQASSIYFSVLFRRHTSSGGVSFDLQSAQGMAWRMIVGSPGYLQIGPTAGFGASFRSPDGLAPVGETIFLVGRMKSTVDNARRYDLQVYVAGVDAVGSEGPVTWTVGGESGTFTTGGMDTFRLRVFGTDIDAEIDELRFGTTWESVTAPASGNGGSDPIAYEGFDYDGRTDLGGLAGGQGWTEPWSAEWTLGADGESLVFPAGTGFSAAGDRLHVAGGGARNAYRPLGFTLEDGRESTYYMSFLLRRGNSTSGLSIDLESTTAEAGGTAANQGWRVVTGTSGQYQIGAASGLGGSLHTTQTGLSPVGETIFLVSKMVTHPDNDREYYLKAYVVGVDQVGPEEPTEWTAVTTNSRVATGGLDRLRVRLFGSNNDVQFDEFRIGTNWQSVTRHLNPLGGFDQWRAYHFDQRELGEPEMSGTHGNPAGDGVSNLVKYALGMDPWQSAAGEELGIVGREDFHEETYLTFSYARPSTLPDIQYDVLASPDLFDWTERGIPVRVDYEEDGRERFVYRDVVPMSDAPARFMNLRVARAGGDDDGDFVSPLPMSYGIDSPPPEYPVARVELRGGERDILREGVKLFTDRDYTATRVRAFEGHDFYRSEIGEIDVVAHSAGLFYVLTPVAGHPGSLVGELTAAGFKRIEMDSFNLIAEKPGVEFDAYTRVMRTNERLLLGDYGVLVFPIKPYELWDSRIPFPASGDIPYIGDKGPGVHQVEIHRASQGVDQFLHQMSLAVHKGELYAAWKNTTLGELDTDALIRFSKSTDGGLTWTPTATITTTEWEAGEEVPLIRNKNQQETLDLGGQFLEFSGLASNGGQLWAFSTLYPDDPPILRMRGLVLNERTDEWEQRGPVTDRKFFPLSGAIPMDNGNWIMGGWFTTGCAISRGSDFSTWDLPSGPMVFHEALQGTEGGPVVYDGGKKIVAVYRNQHFWASAVGNYPWRDYRAVVTVSRDYGESWSNAVESNFPMSISKPHVGKLSTGQTYLVFNVHNPDFYPYPRQMLAIAVSEPGERVMSRVYTVAPGFPPAARYPEGMRKGPWHSRSYPAVVEHEGNLYVAYSLNKEDAKVTIIPVDLLQSP